MSSNAPLPEEVDLLVLGAGAGGMAAALSAAILGLKVLVCEKSAQVGGTASTSAGTVWIPGNRENLRAGFGGDSVDAARRYLESLVDRPAEGREAREAFLRHGPDAIDWYVRHSQLRFLPCGYYPDYTDLPGAGETGRAMIPEPFDGRSLGADFRRVRAPIPEFMVLGGMMVGKPDIAPLLGRFRSLSNFVYAGKLFARYLADRARFPRGTRLMLGNALVARMYASLRDRQVPIAFETKLVRLLLDGGRVTGARLQAGGKEVEVHARLGTVLATGGFGRNPQLRAKFMSEDVPRSMLVPENEGEGVAAALEAGSLTLPANHGSGAFWAPVSHTGSGRWAGLYPHLAMDRPKPGLIAVNSAGRRFVNEADSYHHFVLAMFRSHKSVPTLPAWLVCETRFVARYGLGAIHPGTTRLQPFVAKGRLTVADSLAELASKIGVDAAGLADSVARNNRFAATGVDEDFGKGSTRLNRYNGDPQHQPNPCIGVIGNGPYCAVPVWPAEIGTSAGLETDGDARVLDQRGQPIPGLYACGNDQASVMRGTYPGPGTTLGPALVFGYLAAHHAAGSRGALRPSGSGSAAP